MDNIKKYIISKYINVETIIKLIKNDIVLNCGEIKICRYYVWNELLMTCTNYDFFIERKRSFRLNKFISLCLIFGMKGKKKCKIVFDGLVNSKNVRKIKNIHFLLEKMIEKKIISDDEIDLIIKLISINSMDEKSLEVFLRYKKVKNIIKTVMVRGNMYDYFGKGNEFNIRVMPKRLPIPFHKVIFKYEGIMDEGKKRILNEYLFGRDLNSNSRGIRHNLYKMIDVTFDTFINLTKDIGMDVIDEYKIYWKFIGWKKFNKSIEKIKNNVKIKVERYSGINNINFKKRRMKIRNKTLNEFIMDEIKKELDEKLYG
jgi:hypothetical protein